MKQLLLRVWGNSPLDRTLTFTKVSYIINAVIGIAKLLIGVYLHSSWFVMTAIYYLLLGCARIHAVNKFAKLKDIEDVKVKYRNERTVMRKTGVFLCVLSVLYFLISLNLYVNGDSAAFYGTAVYMIAFIAFTKLGISVYGTLMMRRQNSPIGFSLKIVSFADALVSIVFTQYSLLIFTKSSHAVDSSSILGMVVSVIILILGFRIVSRA